MLQRMSDASFALHLGITFPYHNITIIMTACIVM